MWLKSRINPGKILQSAREFPAWAGGLSGKLGEQHGATIYLEEAGLQIYEKKL
ncbi:MAG: hypothetical protein HC816_21865 [Leptolyngbyaceae cyanobacterium RM1_1_2]|nr:hypothetical protein [Leptolyngbyaceae cyanobacterium RM1_1_2]